MEESEERLKGGFCFAFLEERKARQETGIVGDVDFVLPIYVPFGVVAAHLEVVINRHCTLIQQALWTDQNAR